MMGMYKFPIHCAGCSKIIEFTKCSDSLYCSKDCWKIIRNSNTWFGRRTKDYFRYCIVCSNKFKMIHNKQYTCGDLCESRLLDLKSKMNINRIKQYRKDNIERYNELSKQYREIAKDYINNIKKEGSCISCGIDDFRVLDFHHINPSEKEYSMNEMVKDRRSIESINKEMEKCELVCKNCHAILHHEVSHNGL